MGDFPLMFSLFFVISEFQKLGYCLLLKTVSWQICKGLEQA